MLTLGNTVIYDFVEEIARGCYVIPGPKVTYVTQKALFNAFSGF